MMSRQSVLVVEDEEDIMEVIRFNLEMIRTVGVTGTLL